QTTVGRQGQPRQGRWSLMRTYPEKLLHLKDKINSKVMKDIDAQLLLACRYEPHRVPERLASGADVNGYYIYGWTPLHSACYWQPELIPMLIEAGADVDAADEEFGCTPMHFVSSRAGALAMLNADADLSAKNHSGQTPADCFTPEILAAVESFLLQKELSKKNPAGTQRKRVVL
ncbi:MAG: ankyrin repeat domain-containing protein, partial [Stenotrophobium sp.]